MLIFVRYESKEWIVDENLALLFIEFRKVLQDKKAGAKAMAYIALSCDPDSEFRRSSKDNNDIMRDSWATVYETEMPNKHKPDELMQSAIDRYKKLCNTPENRLTAIFEDGMDALEDRLKELTQITKTSSESLTEFIELMQKAGELRNNYYKMKDKGKDKQQTSTEKIRGGGQKTWAESRRS